MDSKEQELRPLTLPDLEKQEALLILGANVARSLISFGVATFVVEESEEVCWVNPLNVFIDHSAVPPPLGKVPKLVRPVILEGRPKYIALKNDGTIWEVEYDDNAIDTCLSKKEG